MKTIASMIPSTSKKCLGLLAALCLGSGFLRANNITICNSSDSAVLKTQSSTFKVTGNSDAYSTTVQIAVGQCTTLFDVLQNGVASPFTINEVSTANTILTRIVVNAPGTTFSSDLKTKSVTVNVVFGSIISIDFINGPALGQNAYVSNQLANTVSVINTATNAVTATIPVGPAPRGLAVSPDGGTVYVGNSGDDTVSVIDTATNRVTATFPLGTPSDPMVGAVPEGLAISPDGGRLYVADLHFGVRVVDTATNTVLTSVGGERPFDVAVSPSGGAVYFVNTLDNSISVIDSATNLVTATVTTGPNPFSLAVSPTLGTVYVSNANFVSVINPATNSVTATIPINNSDSAVLDIAVSPSGGVLYFGNYSAGTVSVISTTTNTVTATIPVGKGPVSLAVSPDGGAVYVVNGGDNTVSVINTATNAVTATIPVGNGTPFDIAIGGRSGTGNAARPVTDGIYTIKNNSSGLVLDDPAFAPPGAQVIQYFLNVPSSANQRWTISYDPGSQAYTLVNQASHGYLTDAGSMLFENLATGDGTRLWTISGGSGAYVFTNVATGRVIDDPDFNQGVVGIITWPANGGANQGWTLQ